ncbi:uncharacterized protein EAE98_009780 [Botrytis deweyae]|uniref:Zn(2)-C6 fungal-type domain-containing protein n=1 Tax=Botrytis deweyae TaxID=2478750 RepID=A0ABQ7IAU1_9HELO|nr:uncharacterized protein EAE98_009780 [Botrytis deweyae]KAF7918537.1 hypothetical protein EAE98_009780 [Botrytis deweyae]
MPLSTIQRPTRPAKTRSIACRRCHGRKIRCSGTQPCDNCHNTSDCVYPTRDHQVKVNQSYLDRLIRENEQLRRFHSPGRDRSGLSEDSETRALSQDDTAGAAETTLNPVLRDSHWFERIETSETPIWIGEISDAAFATRVRQLITAPQPSNHIPRTHFVPNETIWLLSPPVPSPIWPSSIRAQFLVKAALRALRRSFHVVRRSEIFAELAKSTDANSRSQIPLAIVFKFWALFALGELYTSRCTRAEETFPGLSAFAYASQSLRVVSERPHLDVVETILLLALYSLEVNRRHSTYVLIGTAIRLQNVMGLHLNIDRNHISDPEIREHRNRLWWTTYVLDRMISSKTGLPVSISDQDITVDLPSDACQEKSEDFMEHSVLVINVNLAKIAGSINQLVYTRKSPKEPFLERVQAVNEELQQLSNTITHQKQVCTDQKSIDTECWVNLQLTSNQLRIVASRPVLLYIFCHHIATHKKLNIQTQIPDLAQTLAESCVHYARESCDLLLECWSDGIFDTFNYSFTQYLFSSAVVLAISSSIESSNSQSDLERFQFATSLLERLDQNGNFAAKEFCCHIRSTTSVLQALIHQRETETSRTISETSLDLTRASNETSQTFDDQLGPEATLQYISGDQALSLSFLDAFLTQEELQQIFPVTL